jgi:hypothetical protein
MKGTPMLKHFLGLLAVATLIGGVSQAAESKLIAASGGSRVPLVELYSSESCSSCPPADDWVSTLQNNAGLWKSFVPVVFHVDYWNQLGWKDALSSQLMTKRQESLSKLWAESSVYTPAFIVDGKEWRDWRNQGSSFHRSDTTGISLSVFKDVGGSYRVRVTGLDSNKNYTVRAAELGMGITRDIKGGENSGRLLTHNFVVLDWSGKPITSRKSEESFSFKSPLQKVSNLAIAVWIEEDGNPTPLQSTGGYL